MPDKDPQPKWRVHLLFLKSNIAVHYDTEMDKVAMKSGTADILQQYLESKGMEFTNYNKKWKQDKINWLQLLKCMTLMKMLALNRTQDEMSSLHEEKDHLEIVLIIKWMMS